MNVFVTGSSRGFGYTLCRALAAAGYHVIAAARSKDRLELLQSEYPSRIVALQLDLSDASSIADAIRFVETECKAVDVLVNNAATAEGVGPIWELNSETWHRVMMTNFLGHVELTRGLLKGMIARRSGLILNVCSLAANKPLKYLAPYCVSKAALKHYTLCLAHELHEFGIRANAIGITADTDLPRDHAVQKASLGYTQSLERLKTHKLPPASENVHLALFLISPAGRYITGQYIESHSTVVRTW